MGLKEHLYRWRVTDNLDEAERKKCQSVADKLVRIWVPLLATSQCHWELKRGQFSFEAKFSPTQRFTFLDRCWQRSSDLCALRGLTFTLSSQINKLKCRLCYESNIDDLHATADNGTRRWSWALNGRNADYFNQKSERCEELLDFVGQYLTLFRRNCFLYGCPIECTAHERLEWHLWLQESG